MYQEYDQNKSLSASARQNFVKKVYTVLSVQITATAFMVYANYASPSFAQFQENNTWLFWVAFLTTIISLVSLCILSLT